MKTSKKAAGRNFPLVFWCDPKKKKNTIASDTDTFFVDPLTHDSTTNDNMATGGVTFGARNYAVPPYSFLDF